MEFEIEFYKDAKGNSPIDEFVLKLGKGNRVLAAKTRQGIDKLRHKAYQKSHYQNILNQDFEN